MYNQDHTILCVAHYIGPEGDVTECSEAKGWKEVIKAICNAVTAIATGTVKDTPSNPFPAIDEDPLTKGLYHPDVIGIAAEANMSVESARKHHNDKEIKRAEKLHDRAPKKRGAYHTVLYEQTSDKIDLTMQVRFYRVMLGDKLGGYLEKVSCKVMYGEESVGTQDAHLSHNKVRNGDFSETHKALFESLKLATAGRDKQKAPVSDDVRYLVKNGIQDILKGGPAVKIVEAYARYVKDEFPAFKEETEEGDKKTPKPEIKGPFHTVLKEKTSGGHKLEVRLRFYRKWEADHYAIFVGCIAEYGDIRDDSHRPFRYRRLEEDGDCGDAFDCITEALKALDKRRAGISGVQGSDIGDIIKHGVKKLLGGRPGVSSVSGAYDQFYNRCRKIDAAE